MAEKNIHIPDSTELSDLQKKSNRARNFGIATGLGSGLLLGFGIGSELGSMIVATGSIALAMASFSRFHVAGEISRRRRAGLVLHDALDQMDLAGKAEVVLTGGI
jgi:hypothetical protein